MNKKVIMGEYIERLIPYALLFLSIISVRIMLGFLSKMHNVRMKWIVDVSCILLFHIVGYITGMTFLTILTSVISAFVISSCCFLLLHLYINLWNQNINTFLKFFIMIAMPFLMFYNSFKNIDDLIKEVIINVDTMKKNLADINKKKFADSMNKERTIINI